LKDRGIIYLINFSFKKYVFTLMKTKYIVARYNENIDWLNFAMDKSVIYNKGDKLNIPNEILVPNVGRESETYLRYIIENYDNLPDICVFLQGRISDHIRYARGMKYNPHLNRCLNYVTFLESQSMSLGASYPSITVNANTKNSIWSGQFNKKPWRGYDWYLYNNYKNEEHIIFYDWFVKNIQKEWPKKKFKVYRNAIFSVTKKKILKNPKKYYENLIKQVNWHIEPVEGHFFERSWYYIFNND
jgi:hypothetical protein